MDRFNLDEILASAARLFAERGYDATAIRDIATVSGMPSTSIYYHFKSKPELYRESLVALYEEAFDKISFAVSESGSALEKMDVLVDMVLDLFAQNRVLYTLVQRDIVGTLLSTSDPVIKAYHLNYMRLIEKILEQQAGHSVDSRAATTVASLIFGFAEIMLITADNEATMGPQWLTDQKRYLCEQVRYLCTNLIGARTDG